MSARWLIGPVLVAWCHVGANMVWNVAKLPLHRTKVAGCSIKAPRASTVKYLSSAAANDILLLFDVQEARVCTRINHDQI